MSVCAKVVKVLGEKKLVWFVSMVANIGELALPLSIVPSVIRDDTVERRIYHDFVDAGLVSIVE